MPAFFSKIDKKAGKQTTNSRKANFLMKDE
jgi:hypothetical protein